MVYYFDNEYLKQYFNAEQINSFKIYDGYQILDVTSPDDLEEEDHGVGYDTSGKAVEFDYKDIEFVSVNNTKYTKEQLQKDLSVEPKSEDSENGEGSSAPSDSEDISSLSGGGGSFSGGGGSSSDELDISPGDNIDADSSFEDNSDTEGEGDLEPENSDTETEEEPPEDDKKEESYVGKYIQNVDVLHPDYGTRGEVLLERGNLITYSFYKDGMVNRTVQKKFVRIL